MSLAVEEETTNFYTNPDNDSESSENFQKFITELFEKNGVLNDLRAYLRGHIVEVLKSAETGAPMPCQKHFTQRLELVYQALNMLVAEYLLRLEFNYSLSVFVSEIPLANMVFDLARSLLRTTVSSASALRFDENDVWSVLHYLGIKCDSAHASQILESYKNGDSPLLYCILQCIPFHQKEPNCFEEGVNSDDCLTSSVNSAESYKRSKTSHTNIPHRCKHYAFCKSCQHRVLHLKERYKKRKMKFEKNANHSSMNSLNVQSLLNNIAVIEKGLFDEMFQQLNTVYEAEVAMVREEEEARVKRSIATHALQLQKQREQLEESYRGRQAELERSVHQKKKFLWGLARALRSQHEHMSAAMKDVQYEARRLTEKESSIKSQLDEAEQILKKRGEEMRDQISQELMRLDAHLENMKRERDSINKERDSVNKERDSINKEREELERLRDTFERTSKVMKQPDSDENVELKMHYNSLKDEMVVLRRYIESTKLESKSLVERGTVMELGDGVMNNSLDVRGDDDDRLKGSQVVNDLKKQKNVNFSQSNLDEIYRQLSRTPSRSLVDDDSTHIRGSQPDCDTCNHTSDAHRNRSCDSDVHSNHSCADAVRSNHSCDGAVRSNHSCDGVVRSNHSCDGAVRSNHICDGAVRRNHSCDCCRGCNREMLQLREENERLKTFSKQQRDHIDALVSERAQLQTHLNNAHPRPRTAPSMLGANFISPGRMVPTASSRAFGWCKGAGEELNVYSTSEPRVVLPGDELPFVGALSDRRGDSRRTLISQWQALRRRMSPHARPRPAPPERSDHVVADNTEESRNGALSSHDGETQHQNIDERPQKIQPELKFPREKSPKSVLREAKEKLRNSNVSKEAPAPREKSPSAVLREARTRLRKLEIEAEAVTQSYLHFRRRQMALREERQHLLVAESSLMNSASHLEIDPSKTLQRPKATEKMPTNDALRYDHSTENMKKDFNKYLREYQTNFDIGEIHFYNRNSAVQQTKPIPPYPEISENNEPTKTKNDYLETPLTEFRKLYQTQKPMSNDIKLNIPIPNLHENPQNEVNNECANESKKLEALQKIRNNKQAELEILKENVKKMYPDVLGTSSNDTGLIEEEEGITEKIKNSDTKMENVRNTDPKNMHKLENINADTNLEIDLPQNMAVKDNIKLMLQVENVRETRNVGVTASKNDLLLVVESKVASKDIDSAENEEQKNDFSPSRELSKDFTKLTNKALLDADNDGKEQKNSTQMTIIVSPKSVNNLKDDSSPYKELSKNFTKLTNNALLGTDNDRKEHKISTQMTVNVSPKSVNSPKDSSPKELSENLTKLTNNDAFNALDRAENKNELPNVDMQLQITKDLGSKVNLKDSSRKELSENLTKLTNNDALNTLDRAENNNELPNVDMQLEITKDLGSEVDPKDFSPKELSENLTELTNKDDSNALDRAENNNELSNVDMQLRIAKNLESDVEKDQEEIIDDFSADVDYYFNSLSDGGKNSPISLPRTSEDENFWDN